MTQTVRVPDDLYQRLSRTAEATGMPLDRVVQRVLSGGLPPSVEDVPVAFQEDLRALEALPDDELWVIWRSAVVPAAAARHHELLKQSATGGLTAAGRAELYDLRQRADGLLLQRAQAAAFLRWRGHAVPMMD